MVGALAFSKHFLELGMGPVPLKAERCMLPTMLDRRAGLLGVDIFFGPLFSFDPSAGRGLGGVQGVRGLRGAREARGRRGRGGARGPSLYVQVSFEASNRPHSHDLD